MNSYVVQQAPKVEGVTGVAHAAPSSGWQAIMCACTRVPDRDRGAESRAKKIHIRHGARDPVFGTDTVLVMDIKVNTYENIVDPLSTLGSNYFHMVLMGVAKPGDMT